MVYISLELNGFEFWRHFNNQSYNEYKHSLTFRVRAMLS